MKQKLLKADGSTSETLVLDWITESKIKLRQFKVKLDAREKVKADSVKFERENKLRALPKLEITPFGSPQDWLSWVQSITPIAKTFTKEEISSPQFLSLIKTSINIDEDKKYCRNLDYEHLIINYLKCRKPCCNPLKP